jgi:hypothetical protein
MDNDDVEMTHYADDEEDEEILENVREHKSLLHRAQPPKRSCIASCCWISLVITAMVIFVLFFVQLWTQYGEYIENRVMAPTIAGLGEFNRTGYKEQFVVKYSHWDNNTLYLDMEKPNKYMIVTYPEAEVEWVDTILTLTTNSDRVKLVVYSV